MSLEHCKHAVVSRARHGLHRVPSQRNGNPLSVQSPVARSPRRERISGYDLGHDQLAAVGKSSKSVPPSAKVEARDAHGLHCRDHINTYALWGWLDIICRHLTACRFSHNGQPRSIARHDVELKESEIERMCQSMYHADLRSPEKAAIGPGTEWS